jgi:ribonuclease E
LRIIQEESMKDNTAAVHAQVPVEVAAFLLNEKRPEIAKIELQQRISVLLVPNKSLETPHYKLERLKHDDPRLDRIEASYKMAEIVEDATTVTRRSQEPTNKQTPVIKGVLPDAPAPVAPVKAEAPAAAAKPAKAAAPVKAAAASGGFFGWLKSLFGGSTEEAKPAVTDKKDGKAREGRNGERNGERREGGRRDGRRDGRRGERTERAEGVQGEGRAPREGGRRGEGRNEVRDGEGRPARGERSERPAGERQPREGRRERGDNNRNEAPAELAADGTTEARTERAPRAERGERGEGRRERGEGRGERGEGRGERGEGRRERGERRNNDKAPGELNTAETTVATEGQEALTADSAAPTENNGERRERRSRDRYGRDRRERNGEARQDGEPRQDNDTAVSDAAPAAEANTGEDRPAPRSYFERAQQAAAPVEAAPVETAQAEVAQAEPTPVTAPAAAPAEVAPQVAAPVITHMTTAPAPTPAPAPSAAAQPVPSLPKVASYALPLDSLQQVAQTSGLVWVNSDADKIAAVQAAIAAEPKPVHVPRERPPAVVVNEGPLVLVETRKDLKDMNLPF